MLGFGWLKKWRDDRRSTREFWEKTRAKYADWKCASCETEYEEMKDSWGHFYNVSKSDERICWLCAGRADAERKRRIELARQIVGQLVKSNQTPYRGPIGQSNQEAWKYAVDMVNADPFRAKRYDEFIRL